MPRTRYQSRLSDIPFTGLPAAALRQSLKENYSARDLKSDLLAGVVVGIVALPLSMALAIAVGVPPQYGLYTAIVGGAVVALLGGSRTQVTGPTAAFIVILAPIYTQFGLAGLLLCGLLGGLLLLAMGIARLGRLIEFIPYPVTTGFTAGIGTVIGVLQIKDLFGLNLEGNPQHFLERIEAFWNAKEGASLWEFAIGMGTLFILIYFPRLTKKVPSPLVALPLAAVAAVLIDHFLGAPLATIGSRFETVIKGEIVRGIPRLPPLPMVPWNAPGPEGGTFALSFEMIRSLIPGALAIALLGAIESLLSAVVSDGMAGTKHDPDAELFALGVGNLLCPFFGGIAATGAIARTATSIRYGARSPIASITHAVTVLLAVLALAPLISYLPMTALAALLLLVAWNMAEAKHFFHILRVSPKSDVAVLLTCYFLTVFFDMVVAVSVGVVLAALLFMRRMADVTHARLAEGGGLSLPRPPPSGVMVYEIAGPLFFGAAQKAVGALGEIGSNVRAIILRMDQVPAMDVTGLVALESALAEIKKRNCLAILSGLQAQPLRVLKKADIQSRNGTLAIAENIEAALARAEEHLAQASEVPAK
ncbi:MAG: C4-dicarboxylic acid transporter DauA [Bdellovibrionota bacterium]